VHASVRGWWYKVNTTAEDKCKDHDGILKTEATLDWLMDIVGGSKGALGGATREGSHLAI